MGILTYYLPKMIYAGAAIITQNIGARFAVTFANCSALKKEHKGIYLVILSHLRIPSYTHLNSCPVYCFRVGETLQSSDRVVHGTIRFPEEQ